MLVEVMVISKGEYCDRMHILPLANLTLSGISIHMCLERLVSLIKEGGRLIAPPSVTRNVICCLQLQSKAYSIQCWK